MFAETGDNEVPLTSAYPSGNTSVPFCTRRLFEPVTSKEKPWPFAHVSFAVDPSAFPHAH